MIKTLPDSKKVRALDRTIKLMLIAALASVMVVRATPWFAQAQGLPVCLDKRGRMFEVEKPGTGPSGKPLVLNQSGKPTEVASVARNGKGKPVFQDKHGKVIPGPKPIISPRLKGTATAQKFIIGGRTVLLDANGNVIDTDVGQAGGDGVLLAQNGSLVYYRTTVNDVYAYFLTGTKNGGIAPMPTQFPTTSQALNAIISFPSSHT